MRLGIIGTGRIAKRTVKELSFVDGIDVTAVLNPNLDHAEKFIEDNGMNAKAFSDISEFADAIDAVYVASPHGSHASYVRQMLGFGKHVICEKPMCFSEIEAKELFDMAFDKKLVLMEAVKTEFAPGFKKICEVLESGVIGEVVDVEAAFTRLSEPHGREFDDTEFGGSFTEFGTYCLLPVLRFLGTDYSDVRFMSIPAESGVDGYSKVVFAYEDKSNGTGGDDRISVIRKIGTAKTGLTAKSEGQLLISGTKGYVLVPSPWWLTKYFEVRYEDPTKIDKYECEFLGDGLRYEFTEFERRVSCGEVANSQRDEAVARARVFEKFLSGREH